MKYNYRSGVVVGGKQIFKYRPFVIINLLCVFSILLFYCIRYRPRVLIVENTYDAALIGILRKIGFVKKMVYICGDWLLNPLFPYFDFMACKYADVVWDVTTLIRDARLAFWKKDICKKEFVSFYYTDKKPRNNARPRSKILFIGQVRDDSGVEIALKNKYFKVKVLPFTKREDFKEQFSDCFCGINLITSHDSYTSRTIPSKVMEYIQHGLPVIVTKNCGLVADMVQKNRLGKVINPNLAEFNDAAWGIFNNQEYYIKNIEQFLDSIMTPKLEDIINGMV
jgi:glycosyltransferase involved in cell wall biosynthesis